MATAKSTSTAEINEIQHQMAQIRHELYEDVREVVEGAHAWTDWRSHVRNHPWLTMGTATAIGYLIVPRRRSVTPTIVAMSAPASGLVAEAAPAKQPAKTQGASWSVLGTVFSLLAPVTVRAAQNYAIQYLEQWLTPPPSGPAETGVRATTSGGGARSAATFGPQSQPHDAR